jgi:hypothetical protein
MDRLRFSHRQHLPTRRPYSLRTGGTTDGAFYQDVTTYAEMYYGVISFWYRMQTDETSHPWDYFDVEVRDAASGPLTTLLSTDGNKANKPPAAGFVRYRPDAPGATCACVSAPMNTRQHLLVHRRGGDVFMSARDTHPHTHTYAYKHTHAHAYTDRYSDRYAYADGYPHGYAYPYGHPDRYTHANGHPDGYAYPD